MKPDNDLSVLAGKLTDTQRAMIKCSIPGVVAGQFCCATTPDLIDTLPAGICGVRFEPADFATRGCNHAARLTPLGLALKAHLLDEDSRHADV
jgi:hypothetical protein